MKPKRCRHQIVYDFLKVLEHNSPGLVCHVFDRIKIRDNYTRDKYIELMNSSNLIAVTDTNIGQMAVPGFDSYDYMRCYEHIEKVLNECED